MTIRFIADKPTAFLSDIKALIISDLHIGLEYDLYKSGISIPPQAYKFGKILEKLIKTTKAKKLIILGDLKYKVPGISIRELKEIPKFLENISEKIKVILIKGNHDDEIEKVLPEKVKLVGSRGLKIRKYGFFHGHAWPSKNLMLCDFLFMGHIQPAVEFRDKFGHRNVQQVWLKGKLDEEKIKKRYKVKTTGKLNIIILPSFNMLSGSLIMNKKFEEKLAGPFFHDKALDVNSMQVYLLDGTNLGELSKLKKV